MPTEYKREYPSVVIEDDVKDEILPNRRNFAKKKQKAESVLITYESKSVINPSKAQTPNKQI